MKYQHGSHAAYVLDKCRCDDCKAAKHLYERERARRIEPAYVGADPARQHVMFLREQGVGLKTIARVSGLPHGTLAKLIYGDPQRRMAPSKRIRKRTLDAILAVTPRDAADGAKIDAAPTWRLIDELLAAGVPRVRIAEALGNTGPGLQLRTGKIRQSSARIVAQLHADWKAGRVELHRTRGRTKRVTIEPPPVELRPVADVSDLILDLAEIVELRNSQPWRKDAACRNRPTHIWFPARGDTKMVDAALKVCRACMVRTQCRAEMFDEREGVYAGMSANERRTARRIELEVSA